MAQLAWSNGNDNTETLTARAYGLAPSDLYVDFDRPLQQVITSLLHTCLSKTDDTSYPVEEIHNWTIAKRRQGLLAMAVATNGRLRYHAETCDACGEKLDLEIDLTDFNHDWSEEKLAFEDGCIRLPCPSDLEKIAVDETLLPDILLDGARPSDAHLEEAETILSRADPLADLELDAQCPECSNAVTVPLILEVFLVDELSQQMIGLMDQIHLLALAYHWSESEILSLPEQRRRHYLARIKAAWAA